MRVVHAHCDQCYALAARMGTNSIANGSGESSRCDHMTGGANPTLGAAWGAKRREAAARRIAMNGGPLFCELLAIPICGLTGVLTGYLHLHSRVSSRLALGRSQRVRCPAGHGT